LLEEFEGDEEVVKLDFQAEYFDDIDNDIDQITRHRTIAAKKGNRIIFASSIVGIAQFEEINCQIGNKLAKLGGLKWKLNMT
jgi:hypothetical protein